MFFLRNYTLYAIAIPPLAEQKRIVAKLEELLPLCERLK
jgi:type I restriction enzyme S subunit